MKRTIIAFVVGGCIGFAAANYQFNAQAIYETGVTDGYAHQRTSTLFVANSAYQRGWEDCHQTYVKKRVVKKTRARSMKVASK